MKKRVLTIFLITMLLSATLVGTVTAGVSADEEPFYHTVRYGETLSWIAWQYGVTVQEIMEANGFTNPNYIYAGQRLIIPGVEEGEYVEHVVTYGESLLSIAAYYHVNYLDIARLNGIWNVNLIFVGQKLRIPQTSPTPTVTPTSESGAPTVQEAIIITSPVADEEISSPVTVTGWGSAFENALAVEVLDAEGNVIGQGYATIDADAGAVGPFTGTIEYTAPSEAGAGRVSVYSVGARDGAIEHLNSVSVNLAAATE